MSEQTQTLNNGESQFAGAGKIVTTDEENNNSTGENEFGEITIEQFKNAIKNNLECKGYYDSLVDKSVNVRLEKGIEAWKAGNLEKIIEEEINKRYPQKTETEIKFEEQQRALEKAQAEKIQLELQIKYHDLMAENNLPIDILDFVSGKDLESTINNIKRFKDLTDKIVDKKVQEGIEERFKSSAYTPGGGGGLSGSYGSMWD
ncbi:DUF4355 domain-containing protein [Clostridium cadaveris]|uniref:DUF4355 domain-containing protein n=1 Tax=Clostridium cadaveris TaxID=1529 RepID=A0A316M369_9CLOT|nr:MAG: hypothetical protein DBY38_12110 [Clostridium cadaveris]